MPSSQVSISETPIGQMSINQMPIGEMSFVKMSINYTSVEKEKNSLNQVYFLSQKAVTVAQR
jgi:hypothetical protein